MKVIGYWLGSPSKTLMWAIGKYRVSDNNLRRFINIYKDDPYHYIDTIRQCDIDFFINNLNKFKKWIKKIKRG